MANARQCKAMAKKAASSGLGFQHLKVAYRWDSDTGIQHLFAELNGHKKPRVTKDKKSLAKYVRCILTALYVQNLELF